MSKAARKGRKMASKMLSMRPLLHEMARNGVSFHLIDVKYITNNFFIGKTLSLHYSNAREKN